MKRRKIKHSKVFLIGIFAYIIINGITVFIGKNIDTLVVSNEKIEEYITTKGLLVRDEYIINSTMTGNIEAYFKEGDKVKNLDKVAYVYNNNIDEANFKELESLEKEVIQIEEGQ